MTRRTSSGREEWLRRRFIPRTENDELQSLTAFAWRVTILGMQGSKVLVKRRHIDFVRVTTQRCC